MSQETRPARISHKAAAILLRQLAIAARGGLPLAEVVGNLGDKSEWLEPATVARLEQSLLTRNSLAEALAAMPGLFPEHTVALIKAGEERGQLPLVLDTLAQEYAQVSFDLSVLAWPATLAGALVVVLTFIVIFVIPQFEDMFHGFGAELPPLTQFFVNVSRVFATYWWVIGVAGVLVIVAFRRGWIPPGVRRAIEQATSSFPGLRAYRVDRFSLQLALWLEAGRQEPGLLQPAVRHVQGATRHVWLSGCAGELGARLAQGQKVHEALDGLQSLPRYLVSFTRLAARLPEPAPAFAQLMEMAHENHAHSRDRFTRQLTFWSYMLVGGAVAAAIVAVYLPIFKLGTVV